MSILKKKIVEGHTLSTDELITKGMATISGSGFDFNSLMSNMKKAERHLITIYPDMMDGKPSIDGHRIKAVDVAVDWFEKKYLNMDALCLVYKIQPGAVLVCCWYVARYMKEELPNLAKYWEKWLLKADRPLWLKDYRGCPLPPQKP